MNRVISVTVTGLLLFLVAILVGTGCSQNNPTQSSDLTARLLAQGLVADYDEFDASDNVWRDDFEAYDVGSFPSAWTPDGNGGAIVDDVSRQNAQSLRLFGVLNAAWAGMAYRPLGVEPPFEIRLAVRNGDDQLGGPWPGRGFIGLREDFTWLNTAWRRLVQFTVNNTIISSGGVSMGTYESLTWYDLRILYERPDEDHVQITYWIDHVEVYYEILDASADENDLTNLELTALEGAAWFDPVMVINRH